MSFKEAIQEYYNREIAVIQRLNLDDISEAMDAIYETYKKGGTIYVCGNGGSAATASQMQKDFNKGIGEYDENKYNY